MAKLVLKQSVEAHGPLVNIIRLHVTDHWSCSMITNCNSMVMKLLPFYLFNMILIVIVLNVGNRCSTDKSIRNFEAGRTLSKQS